MAEKKPEWDVFGRIEELEDITLEVMDKLKVAEPKVAGAAQTAYEGFTLALLALFLAFPIFAAHSSNPRAQKDFYIGLLRKGKISIGSLPI